MTFGKPPIFVSSLRPVLGEDYASMATAQYVMEHDILCDHSNSLVMPDSPVQHVEWILVSEAVIFSLGPAYYCHLCFQTKNRLAAIDLNKYKNWRHITYREGQNIHMKDFNDDILELIMHFVPWGPWLRNMRLACKRFNEAFKAGKDKILSFWLQQAKLNFKLPGISDREEFFRQLRKFHGWIAGGSVLRAFLNVDLEKEPVWDSREVNGDNGDIDIFFCDMEVPKGELSFREWFLNHTGFGIVKNYIPDAIIEETDYSDRCCDMIISKVSSWSDNDLKVFDFCNICKAAVAQFVLQCYRIQGTLYCWPCAQKVNIKEPEHTEELLDALKRPKLHEKNSMNMLHVPSQLNKNAIHYDLLGILHHLDRTQFRWDADPKTMSKICINHVDDHFDHSCCKCLYNGEQLIIRKPFATHSGLSYYTNLRHDPLTGSLRPDVKLDRVARRLRKYMSRGFKVIDQTNCVMEKVYDYTWEENKLEPPAKRAKDRPEQNDSVLKKKGTQLPFSLK
jgi:hypothetical protein